MDLAAFRAHVGKCFNTPEFGRYVSGPIRRHFDTQMELELMSQTKADIPLPRRRREDIAESAKGRARALLG